mmetsp:Transcript_25057/g.58308  ORF Transcript_25057/g.58308 Transcript_25057/m.58308 type:complete len:85 (-) Transcript_25057:672-926(-)
MGSGARIVVIAHHTGERATPKAQGLKAKEHGQQLIPTEAAVVSLTLLYQLQRRCNSWSRRPPAASPCPQQLPRERPSLIALGSA